MEIYIKEETAAKRKTEIQTYKYTYSLERQAYYWMQEHLPGDFARKEWFEWKRNHAASDRVRRENVTRYILCPLSG